MPYEEPTNIFRFSAQARCNGCQEHDLKCFSDEDDEKCLSCAAADRECRYARLITINGPRELKKFHAVCRDAMLVGDPLTSHTFDQQPLSEGLEPLSRLAGILAMPPAMQDLRRRGACDSCRKSKSKVIRWIE